MVERVVLECTTCRYTELVDLTEGQVQELGSSGTLQGHCPRCRAHAEFRRFADKQDYVGGEELNLVPPGHEVYHLRPPRRLVNERAHVRITSKTSQACIRIPGREDDIVHVLNMSKGGLGFASHVEYAPGTAITVAVHYVEGGNNLFQPARVVRVHRPSLPLVPGEYGVKFET